MLGFLSEVKNALLLWQQVLSFMREKERERERERDREREKERERERKKSKREKKRHLYVCSCVRSLSVGLVFKRESEK